MELPLLEASEDNDLTAPSVEMESVRERSGSRQSQTKRCWQSGTLERLEAFVKRCHGMDQQRFMERQTGDILLRQQEGQQRFMEHQALEQQRFMERQLKVLAHQPAPIEMTVERSSKVKLVTTDSSKIDKYAVASTTGVIAQ